MDIKNILFTATVSLTTTIIWNRVLFYINNKHSYENSIRNVFRLLNDTSKQIEIQLRYVDELATKIGNEPHECVVMSVVGYRPWAILIDELKKDSVYTAFENKFGRDLDFWDMYSSLRKAAFTINNSFEELLVIAKRGYDYNYDLLRAIKTTFQNDYNDAKAAVYEYIDAQTEYEISGLKKLLTEVYSRQDVQSARDIYENLLLSVDEELKKINAIPIHIVSLQKQNQKLIFMYRDLLRGNMNFVETIKQVIETMEKSSRAILSSNIFFSKLFYNY